jgi:hypothetical protein
VTTLEHPPYSLKDLAPADFYIFLRLKSALQGRRFCDATDILRTRWNNWESLKKTASGNVSINLTFPNRSAYLHKRTIFKKMQLQLRHCFVFLRNKMMPATFLSYHVVTSYYFLKCSLVLRPSNKKFMNILFILYACYKFHSSMCIILFHGFYGFLMTCSSLLCRLRKRNEYLGETSVYDTKIHKWLMKHVRQNYIWKTFIV